MPIYQYFKFNYLSMHYIISLNCSHFYLRANMKIVQNFVNYSKRYSPLANALKNVKYDISMNLYVGPIFVADFNL